MTDINPSEESFFNIKAYLVLSLGGLFIYNFIKAG